MKKLPKTLDEVWCECLKMWEWIAEQVQGGRPDSVGRLKEQWLVANDYDEIVNNCFFCKWALKNMYKNMCAACPARLIDPAFRCLDRDCHFKKHPLLFYQKLVELNKIRIKKKKAKK